jgi:hypothetical protein
MQRADFRNETLRLANGFGVDMTHDRLEALWDRFGGVSLDLWRAAVTDCLCEPKYPTLGRLETAVEAHRPPPAAPVVRIEPHQDRNRDDYDIEAECKFRDELKRQADAGDYFAKAFLGAHPIGPNARTRGLTDG